MAATQKTGAGKTVQNALKKSCEFDFERMLPGLDEEKALLAGAGVGSIDELFSDIPEKVRLDRLDLPDGLTECELAAELRRILGAGRSTRDTLSFLGAGIYSNYVPAVVRAVTSRSEFYTSYTPYQAEASQGILQALFEFQSQMCELTGMEVTNTSMYDGATALGEAAGMAHRITRRSEILVPRSMHWEKRQVLETYCRGPGLKVRQVPFSPSTGGLDLGALGSMLGGDTAAVVVSNPNFFGVWEEAATELKSMLGEALLIVDVNPLSLGIAKAPGDYGADIVVGEGQSLGVAMSLGGPAFGILTTRKKYLRDMPGRLIGMTRDADGRRAFCMTLQTREQHIRRAKATSNICSNEALCSLAAAAYLSVLGRAGLRRLGIELAKKASELSARLCRVPGIESPVFKAAHFNEFVLRSGRPLGAATSHAVMHGVFPGVPLRPRFPELGETLLVTASQGHTPQDFERLAAVLSEVSE